MKCINYILITLAIAFTSTSCVTLKPREYVDSVQFSQLVNFIEPTVYFAANRVLDKSTSAEDLTEKATIIYTLSQAVLTTLETGSPTPNQLEEIMLNLLPDKPHWAELAEDITEVYVAFYAQELTEEQSKNLYVVAIKDIAKGLIRATKPYIK